MTIARPAVACAAIAATAVGVLLVCGPWTAVPPELVAFDGTPIPAAINDASAQARVHRYQLFVAGLAVVGIAMLVAPRIRSSAARRLASPAASRSFQQGAAVSLAAVIAGVTWHWIVPRMAATTPMIFFAGFYAVAALSSLRLYVVTAIVAAVALPLVIRMAPRVPARVGWLLLAAYSLAVTLPGLFEPLVLVHTPSWILRIIEWHFDTVLGGSYTLVTGSTERSIGYTYVLSLVKALIERRVGYLSFAADVRLVQALNVAFALAALWACYTWDRARPLIAVLTLALVLPWVHNNHQNIFFPNQSGVRFMFFPLAIVLFRYAHRLTAGRAALAWGAFAALALLWNVETGVAVTAGIVVHLGARAERLSVGSLLPSGLRFLAGAAAGFVAVGLLGGVGLGLWPLAFDLPRRLVQRTATGFGYGYPLYLDPLAIVIFGYAIWAVLDLVAARRDGAVDPRAADRGALGVVTLVWAAYYVLQPHPWNVWSYLLPGGLLLGDSLFPAGPRPPWLRIPVVLAVTIVIPAAAAGTVQTWQALERGTALAGVAELDSERLGRRISGVLVIAGDARAIEERAAYLRSVPADTVVVTANSYLLPKLSGRAELFRQRDPVYSATTRSQFEEFLSAIRARSPSRLLVDDPATLARDDPHRKYFARLEAGLADRYRLERVQSGWSIWTRAP
jgi:hypothetical protein